MTTNELFAELDEILVDRIYGGEVEREEPCQHGHLDCAVYEGGPCANEQYARLSGVIETNIEREVDERVQRVLAIDAAYRNAENAEEQAAREAEIEAAVTRDVVSRKIKTLSD